MLNLKARQHGADARPVSESFSEEPDVLKSTNKLIQSCANKSKQQQTCVTQL